MSEPLKKGKKRTGASSPEARAKAVATMKARRAAKNAQMEIPLDAIPDNHPASAKPARRYRKSAGNDERVALARDVMALVNKILDGGVK